MSNLPFGHIIEGVVEQDPVTDRFTIRTVNAAGQPEVVDILELFQKVQGSEVRFTLATLENLAQLAALVEAQGGGEVMGVHPQALPQVPFDIRRKN